MPASDLVNLSGLLDDAKCSALVRQLSLAGVVCAVPGAAVTRWSATGATTPNLIGSAKRDDAGAAHRLHGCCSPTSSRRWFRISGRAAKRAATRSSTASLQARHTPGFVGGAARAERAGPAGVRVTVVDLLQPTHMRAVTRSKPLPSWAEISFAVWVVAKLVLAEEAAAHRWPPLRARHVGHNPGLLAGFEILGLEGARRSVSDAPSLPPAGRSSWTLSEDPRPS